MSESYTDTMLYLFLAVSVLAAVANNMLLHLPILKRCRVNEFAFNGGVAAVWIVLLLAFNGGLHGYSSDTFLYGALYGIVLAGFLFCKMQAFANGPIHFTSLIGSSSFILTTVFNAVYWKEAVSPWQIAGIVLMLAAVFLITYRPRRENTEQKQKLTWKWKIYAAFFFLFSALTGIIFRFHQAADTARTDEMMIFASAVVIALLAILGSGAALFGRRRRPAAENIPAEENASAAESTPVAESTPAEENASAAEQQSAVQPSDGGTAAAESGVMPVKKRVLAAGALTLACGVAGCVYNRLNIYLSGAMANAVFFPLFNGGNIILSTLAGWLLFRETLSKMQIVGIACGMAAVVLVSNFFGLF